MKDMLVRNKNNKFGLKSKLLLGALALAVIAGLGTAVQAAREDADSETDLLLLYRQTALFNPFTLDTRTLSTSEDVTGSVSGTGILSASTGEGGHSRRRPAIRIPFRPVLRSPFQPL